MCRHIFVLFWMHLYLMEILRLWTCIWNVHSFLSHCNKVAEKRCNFFFIVKFWKNNSKIINQISKFSFIVSLLITKGMPFDKDSVKNLYNWNAFNKLSSCLLLDENYNPPFEVIFIHKIFNENKNEFTQVLNLKLHIA